MGAQPLRVPGRGDDVGVDGVDGVDVSIAVVADGARWGVDVDGAPALRDLPDAGEALRLAAGHAEHVMAELAVGFVFVHAGVVAFDDRAVVLPGHSFHGKTTAVRALVEAGATYYSDEFAVLDPDGLVHPYARDLSVRPPTGHAPAPVTPAALGATVGSTPIPVGVVVLAHYRAGARWAPRRLTPGAGVLALMGHTVPARRNPPLVLDVLSKVAERAPVLKGARGDVDTFVPRLLRRAPWRAS